MHCWYQGNFSTPFNIYTVATFIFLTSPRPSICGFKNAKNGINKNVAENENNTFSFYLLIIQYFYPHSPRKVKIRTKTGISQISRPLCWRWDKRRAEQRIPKSQLRNTWLKYSNSGVRKHLSCKIESSLDVWKYLGFYDYL